jgi:hypothetical protein
MVELPKNPEISIHEGFNRRPQRVKLFGRRRDEPPRLKLLADKSHPFVCQKCLLKNKKITKLSLSLSSPNKNYKNWCNKNI